MQRARFKTSMDFPCFLGPARRLSPCVIRPSTMKFFCGEIKSWSSLAVVVLNPQFFLVAIFFSLLCTVPFLPLVLSGDLFPCFFSIVSLPSFSVPLVCTVSFLPLFSEDFFSCFSSIQSLLSLTGNIYSFIGTPEGGCLSQPLLAFGVSDSELTVA